MKKLTILAVGLAMLGLGACNNKEKDQKLQDAETRNIELEGDVNELVATQDSLLMLVNDITEGMNQIKELERIISSPAALQNESPSRKEQIKNDIIAIQNALKERRERLDILEKKLNDSDSRLGKSSAENATLKKTITALKTQIADQQTEISTLTNQLAAANIQIKELGNTVAQQTTQINDLNTAVENESRERQIAQAEAQNLNTELNTCYYCIGSKKELKANGILQSGFLKKTKIMQGDFNANYFTKGDKRNLTQINTHSKKAQVMTNMPKDSYEIVDVNGEKVINITNPAKFWSLSNFLVIKVG